MSKKRKAIFYLISYGFLCFLLIFPLIFNINSFRNFGLSFYTLLRNFVAMYLKPYSVDIAPVNVSGYWTLYENGSIFPFNIELFGESFKNAFKITFTKEFFFEYLLDVVLFLLRTIQIILLVVPVILILFILLSFYLTNKKEQTFSKPLLFYNKKVSGRLKIFKRFLRELTNFFKSKKLLVFFLIIVLLFDVSLLNVASDVLSLLFYTLTSFDFVSLFYVVPSVLYHLYPIFSQPALFIFTFVLVCFMFNKVLHFFAKRKLENNEKKNAKFAESLGISTMILGEPGSGKTAFMVDLSLTIEQNFYSKLEATQKKMKMYFPNFNWDVFTIIINRMRFANKYQYEQYLDHIAELAKKTDRYFGYSLVDNIFQVYDEKRILTIFEATKIYAAALVLYRSDTLIFSNMAVRSGNIIQDGQNTHSNNFFLNDMNEYSSSVYSRPADYNLIRRIKQMGDSPFSNIVEGGVFLFSEGGKEFGNQNTNKIYDSKDEAANPLNDGFVEGISEGRHPTTIEWNPYFQCLIDDQRSSSIAARLVELCENQIFIRRIPKKTKLALHFYKFTPLLLLSLLKLDEYVQARNLRTDRTLLLYFLDYLVTTVYKRNMRIINFYTYDVQELEIEKARGVVDTQLWYRAHKKVFNTRYPTDHLRSISETKWKESTVSQFDIPNYPGMYPDSSFYEKHLHSHYWKRLSELQKKDETKSQMPKGDYDFNITKKH